MRIQMRRIAVPLTSRALMLAAFAALITSLAGATGAPDIAEIAPGESAADTGKQEKVIELRIVFDNNAGEEEFETKWGFACVITGCKKRILFDTGLDGAMLLRNLERAGVDPKSIDAVVLSHIHGDHTGGLKAFLEANGDVTVYLPKVFPQEFKDQVRAAAAEVVETDSPNKICDGLCTTGVLGGRIPEQGIYVQTAEGILVVTGCAHPGIVQIAKAARDHSEQPIRFVVGGFHLVQTSADGVRSVIDGLKKLEAEEVAPTHCTGDPAREAIKTAFGDKYKAVGAGSRMVFPAPKPEDRLPATTGRQQPV